MLLAWWRRGKANANTNYPIDFYASELQWLETTSFNQVVAAIRARARGGQCIGGFPPTADETAALAAPPAPSDEPGVGQSSGNQPQPLAVMQGPA